MVAAERRDLEAAARTFDASERGRALGLNGVSVSLGLSLGPALGGVLTWLVVRQTTRAVETALHMTQSLPQGDLTFCWPTTTTTCATTSPGSDR